MTATRPVMTNSHVQNLPHILMITGGGVTAADYVEGRGLAGAVRTDETVDHALVHVQVEAVDGDDAAKSANEVANLEDGRLGFASDSASSKAGGVEVKTRFALPHFTPHMHPQFRA